MKSLQALWNPTVHTAFRYFRPFWRRTLVLRTEERNCVSYSGVRLRALEQLLQLRE